MEDARSANIVAKKIPRQTEIIIKTIHWLSKNWIILERKEGSVTTFFPLILLVSTISRRGRHFVVYALTMTDRRGFLTRSMALGLLASGCSVNSWNNRGPGAAANSVAVLGVVQSQGVDIAVNTARLAADLQGILRDEHNYAVMPVAEVRNALGQAQYETLLRRVAVFGTLEADDVRILTLARLPTSTAVILVITDDDVRQLDKERVEIRDNNDEVLLDRDHVILSTARIVSLTATVMDTKSGRVRMHNEFTQESIERRRYLEYNGSSFTGTVAARLANTVANGVRQPDWPDPPLLHQSFYALLEDVADELPVN